MPLAVSINVILAPATGPPEGSKAVPARVPVYNCPHTATVEQTRRARFLHKRYPIPKTFIFMSAFSASAGKRIL